MVPRPPTTYSGKRVAVIGSGPAGRRRRRARHEVTVFERAPKAGGLLVRRAAPPFFRARAPPTPPPPPPRTLIPNMKLDKNTVQRRIDLMAEEGVSIRVGNTEVGSDAYVAGDD